MKFKAGDKIVMKEGTSQYERVVVGYSQKGYVVYEYKSASCGQWSLTSGHEDQYKLAPVKKEGWVNVYNRPTSVDRTGGVIYASKDEAMRNRGLANHVAVVHIEWEE